jgi:hypothetical protein
MATAEASIVISAQDKFSAVFGQASAGLGKIQQSATALSNVLGGIAAGGFVASLGQMIRSTVNLGDELNKLSQRTGITVESLSAIQNAAELADVSTEEFTGGIRKLNLALVEAQDGTSKTAQIFKALGVDTTRGAEVALRGISTAFAQLPDGATKAAVATEIFGRAGEKLIPLLNGGAGAIDQARAAAERYGTLISGKLAADSEQFNDNLTKLAQSSRSLGVSFANSLLPGLVTISDNLVRARERGEILLQVLREVGKLYFATVGGVEQAIIGREGPLGRSAAANFANIVDAENGVDRRPNVARGRIGRPEMGPSLPVGRAPDPTALLRALAPSGGAGTGAGRAAGGLSMEDLMAQGAARRIAVQDANESAFNADADRQQRALLDFYADLAMAQQLRIELAQQEGERAQESLQREADAIKDRLDPTREYIRALERVAELQAQGLLNDREALAETNRLADALRNAGKAATDSNDLARSLGLTFTSAFEQAISGGRGLRDIFKGLEADLLRLGTRQLVTQPFLKFLGNATGSEGGGGSGFADIFATLAGSFGFGGARAMGGPVSAGMGYLVGERGPELFMPRQSGTIVPNGAGSVTVVQNISTPDVNSFRASQGQLLAQAQQQMARSARRNG